MLDDVVGRAPSRSPSFLLHGRPGSFSSTKSSEAAEAVAPIEYNYRDLAEMKARKGPNGMKGEEHGLSVFFWLEDEVFHTYSVYARGTEALTDAYSLLDQTPFGRQQSFEDSPAGWPQRPTNG